MRNFYVFFLFYLLSTGIVYGQDQPPAPNVVFNDSLIEGRDYFVVYDTVGNVDPLTSNQTSANSEVSVIVEFVDEPMASFKSQNKSAVRTQMLSAKNKLQSRIDQLQGDLDRLSAQLTTGLGQKSTSAKINRSYYKVFTGVHLRVSQTLEKEIKALPYVKNVYPDQQVETTLEESVKMINADQIWQDYGVYGEGIKVGIIDTGIDYTHPDLGGGYGEGFKVAGGYDFVNDDDDPMDDHSHGTHVAGIVAADGETIKGVAPKATLYALKVLAAAGIGYSSDIIAAIEWSVDPDGDGDPSDKLDVVNMSLGGPGDSDDPMSVAVDNAINMGVTYCIAAGNSGGYYTIGSPGTSRKAITVGSIHKSGQISSFSSKGPTPKNFLIKPDIVAPGASIKSTIPGGGYEFKSGTSMASPHVAGAAALVLNLNPEWGPNEIKAAFMQTATKIEGNSFFNQGKLVFDQGKGIINLKVLAETESLVAPGSISFGLISSIDGVWTKTDTILVENLSDEVKSYEIDVVHNQSAGVSMLFNRETLELMGGEKGYFVYTAEIDPDTFTASKITPLDYGGEIVVKNESKSYQIPYSFFSGNILTLNFNVSPGRVLIHDRNGKRATSISPGNTFVRPLSAGTYDLIVFFAAGRRIVVKEGLIINGNVDLEMKDSDAIHEVILKGLDVDGDPVEVLEHGYWSLIHKSSNVGFNVTQIVASQGKPPKFSKRYFSDVSDNYEFQSNLGSYPSWNDKKHFYSFPVFIDQGITQSFTYSNDATDFVKLVYEFPYPDKEAKLLYTKDVNTPGHVTFKDIFDPVNTLSYPFEIEEYLLPLPHKNYVSNKFVSNNIYLSNTGSSEFDKDVDSLLLTTARMSLMPDGEKIAFWKLTNFDRTRVFKKANSGYAKVKLLSTPTDYRNAIHFFGNGLQSYRENPIFYDAFNNIKREKINYTIIDEINNVIKEWFVYNGSVFKDWSFQEVHLAPNHRLNIRSNGHKVGNRMSESIVTYRNLHKLANLFLEYQLNTLNSGEPTNIFSTNEKVDVKFHINSDSLNIPVKLYFHKEGQIDWVEVETEIFVDEYQVAFRKGTFTPNLGPGYYSLKIEMDDESIQIITQPALLIQSDYSSDSLALAEFYLATNGEEWTNKGGWLENPNLENWYGVTVEFGRVVAIDLPGNNLIGHVPKNFSKLSAIQRLDLKDNSIEVLSDLSVLDHLKYLDVSVNKLNFKDLLPNNFVENFIYSPQDSIGSGNTFYKNVGENLALAVDKGGSGNQFTWMKDDEEISLAQDTTTFVIDSLKLVDSGKYYCQISNALLPELKLNGKMQQVMVSPADFRSITHWDFLNGNHNTIGVNWVDYDSDSDQDLFLVGLNDRNKLLRNDMGIDGSVEFIEVQFSGITDNIDSYTGSSWADYDNDGFPDFYLTTQVSSSKNFLWKNANGSFTIDESSSELNNHYKATRSASWGDYDEDGMVDLIVGNDPSPKLFQNSASNVFTFNGAARLVYGSMFSSWSDFDDDGDLDLFMGSTINRIYKNEKAKFEELELDSGGDFLGTTGASWGDCDNDGDLDLYITIGKYYGPVNERNRFFLNQGKGELVVTDDFGFSTNINNSFGSSWGDYDNDGDLDLFVANFYEKNELWQNQLIETGVLNFVPIKGGAIANDFEPSRAAAWADYDKDGDLDLFVANEGENNNFYQNLEEGNNWVNVLCHGSYTNRSAIGTKVKLKATINGKSFWQTREISAQTGLAAQNSLNVEFGLGDAQLIDSLVIEWASTGKQTLSNIEPNQFITVEEQPDIFIFPIKDVKIPQNDTLFFNLKTLYSGNGNLALSLSAGQEKVKSTLDGNVLRIESNSLLGSEIIEVTVTDGKKSYSTMIDVEVYNEEMFLFIFPEEDIRTPQKSWVLINLDVLYYGDKKLSYLVNYDPEKMEVTLDKWSRRLVIYAGTSIGSNIIEVSVTDGEKSYAIDIKVEVYENKLVTDITIPNQELDVSLYPNPSDGNVTLEIRQGGEYHLHLEIFSSLGEKVFHKEVKNITNEYSEQLELNQLTPGIYIAKMLVNNQLLTKKIIIK